VDSDVANTTSADRIDELVRHSIVLAPPVRAVFGEADAERKVSLRYT
jgi:hypothetical protein